MNTIGLFGFNLWGEGGWGRIKRSRFFLDYNILILSCDWALVLLEKVMIIVEEGRSIVIGQMRLNGEGELVRRTE